MPRGTPNYITYNGETHSLTEWSRITGIARGTIYARLAYGATVEEALDPGNHRHGPKSKQIPITYNGETHCIAEWERRLGINKRVAYHRLARGWTVEEALGIAPPPTNPPMVICHNGETHTIREWSEITGISVDTMWSRIQAGRKASEVLYVGRLPRKEER